MAVPPQLAPPRGEHRDRWCPTCLMMIRVGARPRRRPSTPPPRPKQLVGKFGQVDRPQDRLTVKHRPRRLSTASVLPPPSRPMSPARYCVCTSADHARAVEPDATTATATTRVTELRTAAESPNQQLLAKVPRRITAVEAARRQSARNHSMMENLKGTFTLVWILANFVERPARGKQQHGIHHSVNRV